MKVSDFTQELQTVASEMKLTKSIFHTATKEQLQQASETCRVESYKWDIAECHFLLKGAELKGCKLFQNNEEMFDDFDINELYQDFKENGSII